MANNVMDWIARSLLIRSGMTPEQIRQAQRAQRAAGRQTQAATPSARTQARGVPTSNPASQTSLFNQRGGTRNFSTAAGRNAFPTTTPVPTRGAAAVPPNRPPGGFGGQAPGQRSLFDRSNGQGALPPGRRGGEMGGGALARRAPGGAATSNNIVDVRVRDAFPRQMVGSSPQNSLPPSPRGGALLSQRTPVDPYSNPMSPERARGRARAQYNQAASAAEQARAARASGNFPSEGPAVRRAPGRVGTPQTPAGGRRGALSGKSLRGAAGKLLGPASGAVLGLGSYNENRAAGRSQTTSALKGIEDFARNATGIGAAVNTVQGIRGMGYDMLGIPKNVQNVMNIGDALLLGPAGVPGAMEPLYNVIDRASARATSNSQNQSPTSRSRFPGANQQLPRGTSPSRGPITGSMQILPRNSSGGGTDGGVGDINQQVAPTAPRLPRPRSTAPINMAPQPSPVASVFTPRVGQAPRPNAPVATANQATPNGQFSGVGPVADGARYQDKLNAASAAQNPGAPDPERRRAFLDAKDSMAGAKAVRDLKERRRRLTIELD